jgi:predicted ATP-dependent protease
VIKANSNASTISGPSAGCGVYMVLISAFLPNCAIPKNFAITGALDTEKKELPNDIEPVPKKYQ